MDSHKLIYGIHMIALIVIQNKFNFKDYAIPQSTRRNKSYS